LEQRGSEVEIEIPPMKEEGGLNVFTTATRVLIPTDALPLIMILSLLLIGEIKIINC
jgi:hypothetical protein